MLHETVDEPISILISFGNGKVLPLFFSWRGKKYKVEKLNLVHKKRDGQDTIYYFNVSDAANYFKLAFSTRSLSWRLAEWYAEG